MKSHGIWNLENLVQASTFSISTFSVLERPAYLLQSPGSLTYEIEAVVLPWVAVRIWGTRG